MNVDLWHLHPKQKQITTEAKRFNVVRCGRRWGKSKLAQNLTIEPALDGYPIAYFAPDYKKQKQFFIELLDLLHDVIKSKDQSEFYIELITGGYIECWTLKDKDAGRSRAYKRVVIDEAGLCGDLEQIWLQAIRPTLTDYKGDAWFLGTPKGRNYFHTLCEIAKNREDWNQWHFPTSTNPFIDPKEIEAAKMDMPDFEFRQEYLAEFADNELNPFGFDYIRAALVDKLSNKPTQYFGIDVAFKNDWTVIIGLDEDGVMSHYQRFQKPLPETERIIKETVKDSRAIMDSTGLGQSMYQNLRLKCMGLKGMTYTSGKGDNSKYRLINGLISALQSYDIKILESEVSNELFNFTYIYNSNGDIKYEAPSGLHDDCVNALALAVKSRNLAPVYQPFRLGDELIE